MAMEKQFVITDTHSRTITALGFHPIRREIVVGFEDGLIKWWEQDTGKLMLTTSEHTGHITNFQYWADQKTLLSSGNDGLIIAWGSGGNCADKIRLDHPVYAMCLSLRKQQIICGVNGGLYLYKLDPRKESGNLIDPRKPYQVCHHYDIVPCVIAHDSKVFSAGYDGRLCIYDTTLYPGKVGLDLTHVNSRAHEAGINCMILVKDNENNTWLITGSFDRSVKIWSQDGQLRNRLETIFLHTITSLCYIPRAKVVWIAAASQNAILFDPKAGENVTEFLPTFQSDGDDEVVHKLLKLRYNPDSGQIIGTTNRRHLIVWKFNSMGCITALRCDQPVESLTYTRKVPMLIFSGGNNGDVFKWERLQSSYFMYSMECLSRRDCVDKMDAIRKEYGLEKLNNPELKQEFVNESLSKKSSLGLSNSLAKNKSSSLKNITSHYSEYNKALVMPSFLYKKKSIAVLSCLYVEHLDLLLLASEDSYIYVWGFDVSEVSVLARLTPEKKESDINQKFSILLDPFRCNTNIDLAGSDGDTVTSDQSPVMKKSNTNQGDFRSFTSSSSTGEYGSETKDSVTNRVAGYVCKDVLSGHKGCVTAIAVIYNEELYEVTYLISSGWDRRILIWCLETGELVDRFRNTSEPSANENEDQTEDRQQKEELACDGVILDIEYCAKRNEFAYTSSDGMVYIREFNPCGSGMLLRNTLQGHELEITAVRWNEIYQKWITASEDGTINIWSEDGMTLERSLSTDGPVLTMCIDKNNGSVVAAVESVLKVYDLESSNLVQTNKGHTENIRSVFHFVERSQYVTGSWDQTVRVWNAYKRPVRRRKAVDKKNR